MQIRTTVAIDEKLIKEAMKLTSLKTKKEVVNLALRELVSRLRRKRLIEIRPTGIHES